MKQIKLGFLLFIGLVFPCFSAYPKESYFPKETLILELPERAAQNWKEISRSLSEKECLVERIPAQQTAKNWTDLISIFQYKTNSQISLSSALQLVHKGYVSYPKNSISWKILELNENSAIYEMVCSSEFENVMPEHLIGCICFKDKIIHSVFFNKREKLMDLSERASWIDLLRKHTLITDWDQAFYYTNGLSLFNFEPFVIRAPESFLGWKMERTFALEHVLAISMYIPKSQENSTSNQWLEIKTMPGNFTKHLNPIVEKEKEEFRRRFGASIALSPLQESKQEISYTFLCAEEGGYTNAVVRSFVTGLGYYSFRYFWIGNQEMTKEENLLWLKKLKTIETMRDSP